MTKQEAITAVVHAAPPAGAVGIVIFGLPVSHWMLIGGGIVLVLQAIYWSLKVWKELKK